VNVDMEGRNIFLKMRFEGGTVLTVLWWPGSNLTYNFSAAALALLQATVTALDTG
jgi:hypothetical protein